MRRFLWWTLAIGCWAALGVAIITSCVVLAALWQSSRDPELDPIVWRYVLLVAVAVAVPVGLFFGAQRAWRKARRRPSALPPNPPPMPPVGGRQEGSSAGQ
jgi:formate hydrogenlyase subunit 3/multisubunit Na+/H+ antiporter MnhD subunit